MPVHAGSRGLKLRGCDADGRPMDSLFDGTSRLAQWALLVFGIAAMMTVGSALYSGSAKLGPMVMVVAGGLALAAYMRDREDYGMWPAYVTFGAVLIGVVVSIPLMTNARGMREIAIDGQRARDDINISRTMFQKATMTCVPDGPHQNCTAASIAKTVEAMQAHVLAKRDCTDENAVCVSDEGATGYRVEFVTGPVKETGPLRIQEQRTFRHQVIATTCGALDPEADPGQVKAACGEGAVIAPAGGK